MNAARILAPGLPAVVVGLLVSAALPAGSAFAQSAAACDAARQQGRTLRGCPGTRRPSSPRPPDRDNQRQPARAAAARTNPTLAPGAVAIRNALAVSARDWVSDREFLAIQERVLALGTLSDIRALAESGNARAQFLMGRIMLLGLGGAHADHGEAFAWWRRAAEAGEPRAHENVGNFHYFGGTVLAQSFPEAIRHFAAAAAAGLPHAQYRLGEILLEGRQGVPQDPARGLMWMRRAATAGHPPAMSYLALHNIPLQ